MNMPPPSFTDLTSAEMPRPLVDGPRVRRVVGVRPVTKVVGLLLALYFVNVWVWHYAYLGKYMFAKLEMNDFGKFYYSAKAFLDGHGMYGPTPATAVQVSPTEVQEFLNLNPPHFHLLVLPLALLPPAGALFGWVLLNVVALGLAVRVALRSLDVRPSATQIVWTVFCALALAGPLGSLVVTGQLTWLLTAVIAFAWVRARRGDWVGAAGWVGAAVSIKPFLATLLLLPMMRRDWRALVRAGLACGACGLAGLLVFGAQAYRDWLGALGAVTWPWPAMNMSILGWLSRTFDTSAHFLPVVSAPSIVRPVWMVASLLVASVTIAAVIASEWMHRRDHSFALLILMALLVSPLGWVYYMWLALPPLLGVALKRSSQTTWPSRITLAGAAVGFACPVTAIPAFSESGWIGTGIGSIYFWAALVLWGAVVWDVLDHARSRSRVGLDLTDVVWR